MLTLQLKKPLPFASVHVEESDIKKAPALSFIDTQRFFLTGPFLYCGPFKSSWRPGEWYVVTAEHFGLDGHWFDIEAEIWDNVLAMAEKKQ